MLMPMILEWDVRRAGVHIPLVILCIYLLINSKTYQTTQCRLAFVMNVALEAALQSGHLLAQPQS